MAMTNRVGVMSSQDDASRALAAWLAGPRAPSPARGVQAPLVLFLSHSNTASSIMAEAILEHFAQARVRAASAGDVPAGQVSPYALECLRVHGVATTGLRSKGWGEFFGLHKPPVGFLISLADVDGAKANWDHDTRRPVQGRWGMADPAAVVGSDVYIRRAFEEAFGTLESRIRKFLALPLDRLTDRALSRELALIGAEP
jgi:arsenate reductase